VYNYLLCGKSTISPSPVPTDSGNEVDEGDNIDYLKDLKYCNEYVNQCIVVLLLLTMYLFRSFTQVTQKGPQVTRPLSYLTVSDDQPIP